MRMDGRITKDYEENIKKWYEEVKHYLYTCKELAANVFINGYKYEDKVGSYGNSKERDEYSFLRILPLIIILYKKL